MAATGKSGMPRWPDFFIVGAPRCGTTSLYYYLKGHPDIFMPSVKEPHFFADPDEIRAVVAARGFAAPPGMVKREEDYLRLFKKARSGQITGEASVNYLAHHESAHRIKEKNPRAKIIAVLRQPIDRAYSYYNYLLGPSGRIGREGSFYEVLQEERSYVAKYSDDWGVYIGRGLYHDQVERYMVAFGRAQVRVYLYEDLASDTTAIVSDVCSFLQVPFNEGRFFDPDRKYNTNGTISNPLANWLGHTKTMRSLFRAVVPAHLQIPLRDQLINRRQPKPTMDPRAREFLRSIYHDDISKLQDLIGRDLGSWLE